MVTQQVLVYELGKSRQAQGLARLPCSGIPAIDSYGPKAPEIPIKSTYQNGAPSIFTFQLWTILRGKHCQHPILVMGFTGVFGPGHFNSSFIFCKHKMIHRYMKSSGKASNAYCVIIIALELLLHDYNRIRINLNLIFRNPYL